MLQGLESSLHIAVVGFCNRPRVGDNQRISAVCARVCRVDPHLIHEQYCFPQKFHDFFNLNESGDPNKDTCAILTAEGRTFPVDVFYTVCEAYIRTRSFL